MGVWAVALGAVLAAGGLWLAWRRIAFVPPPRWSEKSIRFQGSNGGSQPKGDFGEILTAVILAQEGWRQLRSKLNAFGHGIDGVFFRPHWLTGVTVLITETKVNASPIKLQQLSNAKLIRALGDLYEAGELDEATATAIVRGLKRHAVRKQHWHHSLHNGITTVQRANRHGRLMGRIERRDTAALMESLAMTLSALDRQQAYIETRGAS